MKRVCEEGVRRGCVERVYGEGRGVWKGVRCGERCGEKERYGVGKRRGMVCVERCKRCGESEESDVERCKRCGESEESDVGGRRAPYER